MTETPTHTRLFAPRALVYRPIRADRLHPVLCFLHGSGEAATRFVDGALVSQPLEALLAHESPPWQTQQGKAFIEDFLVVCPQLEASRRWEPTDAPWIDRIVQEAIAQGQGDPSRLILTGFSLGGEGIFQLVRASALAWKTLWAVDPAFRPNTPLPGEEVRVWVHYGYQQPGGQYMEDFARALTLLPESEAPGARRIVSRLSLSHTEVCRAAYGDERVYRWLLC